jgi:hypothetical protein
MTPLDLIVSKLQAAGCDPKPQGTDLYEARCPVHRGRRRNLSVTVGTGGAVLLCCHHAEANGNPSCPTAEIVAALGLTMSDLYPPDPVAVLWPGRNGTPRPKPKTSGKRAWKTPEDALRAVARKIKPQPTKLQSWTYHDTLGKPVMVVGRIDSADGEKTYRPTHALPDGTWAIGDPPGMLPLYRLPEVAESTRAVLVPEGEKCVLTLVNIGAVATTSAHGAKSPHLTDWSPLAGKDVVILPDNDAEGEGYAAAVLRILTGLSPRPTSVKVVRLSGLADGEDVADWLPRIVGDRVGDEASQAARGELQRLVDAAPVIDLEAGIDAPSEASQAVAGSLETEAPIPIPEWPDPPEDVAFHGLAGEVAKLIEPSSEADPVGVLLQFLIGFGNAVGSGLSILADGHHHHANEYGVTVGDTSRARKGTAWRRVRPILAHADRVWADDKVTGGLSSGEGLIWEIRDPILGTDKKTGQPIVTDAGVDDKRVLVVEQEFGNVLRVLAREGNTLSAVLRLGWDGDDLRTMVKHSPARATKPHVSLIGHITAEELARYLSHVEIFNGLGNRILWACVRRSKCLPFGGSINPDRIAGLGNRLTVALDAARTRGLMDWTPAGKKLWESEYGRLTEDHPGLWGASTSRAEAHVLRLGLIYAALDRSDRIADTHVLAGLELWRFCNRSAAHLFGGSVGDPDADAIRDALRSQPGGMTRTEIRRVVFQDHKSSDDVARALALLLRFNLARQENAQTGGRPAERWHAVKP